MEWMILIPTAARRGAHTDRPGQGGLGQDDASLPNSPRPMNLVYHDYGQTSSEKAKIWAFSAFSVENQDGQPPAQTTPWLDRS
jgi:hypothetical protein